MGDILKIDGCSGELSRCCGGKKDMGLALQSVKAAEAAAMKATDQSFVVGKGTSEEHVQATYNQAAEDAKQHLEEARQLLQGYTGDTTTADGKSKGWLPKMPGM